MFSAKETDGYACPSISSDSGETSRNKAEQKCAHRPSACTLEGPEVLKSLETRW